MSENCLVWGKKPHIRVDVRITYPKEMKSVSGRDTVLMFTAVLFTITKQWKQSKCLPTDEWIKKFWYIYTMEYYSVLKKKEVLPFATTWMGFTSPPIVGGLRRDKRCPILLVTGIGSGLGDKK